MNSEGFHVGEHKLRQNEGKELLKNLSRPSFYLEWTTKAQEPH